MNFNFKKKPKSTDGPTKDMKPQKLKEGYEDIDQTDEEQLIVQNVITEFRREYFNQAKQFSTWDKCFQAYTGDLFKKNVPDYKVQELSNFVFSTVETIKPIMLANNPKVMALPNKEEDYVKSDLVQHALTYEWDRTHMFNKLSEGLTTGLIYGNLIVALLWDGSESNGLGEVKPVFISPYNFFVDAMATTLDDAEIQTYACYKPFTAVQRMYPEKAEQIRESLASMDYNELNHGKNEEINGNVRNTSVLYIEMYRRDYSTNISYEDEYDEVKQLTGNKIKIVKLKYPNGRRTRICNDVLLDDGDNPYQDKKPPFSMWKCYPVPNKFWAIGEVEMIISPQECANEIMNNIIESAGLIGNPIWIMDKNCGIEKGSITNRRGLVMRKNPGTEVKREAPTPLPAYISDIVETMKKDIEQISGVYDVTRGEKPTGITAASAIQALNEQAQGRIKLKVQNIELTLTELFSMWLNRVQQYWVTERSIRVMGGVYKPNSNVDAMAQNAMNPQQQQQDPNQQQIIDPMTGQPKTQFKMPDGKSMSFASVSGDMVDGDFDVTIAVGSTMAVNKSARLQQLISMAQTSAEDGLPMVDRQSVLENADIFNVEEILQRFEAIKQQKSQVQPPQEVPSIAINYDSLPPEGQAQAAALGNIKITPEQIVSKLEMTASATQQGAVKQAQMTHENQMAQQDSKNQNDQQMAQMAHENTIQQKGADLKSNLIQKSTDNENQMALQKQQGEIQSAQEVQKPTNGKSDTSNQAVQPDNTDQLKSLEDFINQLSKLDPRELANLIKQKPQIAQLIQMYSQLTQNNQG